MALKTWIGGAAAGSQIDTVTVTTAAAETYTISVAGEDIATYVATGGDTLDTIAQGLVASWNASGNPLGSGITAADTTAATTGTMTLTADTAGVPFTIATAATGTGGISDATTAANYGPNDWNTIANWDDQSLPIAGDDVFIQGSSSILYGLDQSAIALNDLTVRSYSGNLGSPGETLQIQVGTGDKIIIDSTGTSYLSVTVAAGTFDCEVNNTGGGATAGLFLSSPDISSLVVNRGSVAVATDPGDTSTVVNFYVNYITNQSGDASVTLGEGVTLTNLYMTGGSCTVHCPVTTIQNQGGSIRTEGAGAITTLSMYGGSLVSNSSGTIATLNLQGGSADFTQLRVGRTITTLNLSGSSTLMLDTSVVTLTNDVALTGLVQLASSEL